MQPTTADFKVDPQIRISKFPIRLVIDHKHRGADEKVLRDAPELRLQSMSVQRANSSPDIPLRQATAMAMC